MSQMRFLPHNRIQQLLDVLQQAGYQVMAPQPRDGALVFAEVQQASQLPWGIHDVQRPGHYRLHRDDSSRIFAWANGPQAIKPLLFSPSEPLWQVKRDADGRLQFASCLPTPEKRALLGVRPCDLAALTIHDAHFLGDMPDAHYAARREDLLLLSVNCSHPAETCFCVATGDGPVAKAGSGYDLMLDELDEGLVIHAASEPGQAILDALALAPAGQSQQAAVHTQQQQARAVQQRRLPDNLAQALPQQLTSPYWQELAARCLACGNCTAVCPTCFCHSEQELPALDGNSSEHRREWDSCFTSGHSYLHGHLVREDGAQRYRQWLMHKLAWWPEQFGRIGCVGCGRCIAWCPVGIDITVEAQALCREDVA